MPLVEPDFHTDSSGDWFEICLPVCGLRNAAFQDSAQPGCSHQHPRSRRNRSWRRPLLLKYPLCQLAWPPTRCTYRCFPVFLPVFPRTPFAVSVGLDEAHTGLITIGELDARRLKCAL